nr:hypothetical protein [Tanacetum cinerariifolium]
VKKKPTKRCLKDVPVICKFPDVFPKDLPGLPPPRQVEFKIELGVHVDPAKVEAIKSWTALKSSTENKNYEWGKEEEEAFQLLKDKLCSAPILALPKGSEDFVVYCDASLKGYEAVLMQ